MDNLIRVEYRGVAGELAAGDTVVVESCGAGVLQLRKVPKAEAPIEIDSTSGQMTAGSGGSGGGGASPRAQQKPTKGK
jgi:hypothetical protein